ncbi:MAG: C4-type zinc ribbon domain-containing protein [Candidatus Omnitrophota bacterium]
MKDIENLIELQKIDVQIFKIKSDLETKPQEIEKLEENFNGLSIGVKQAEEALKKAQVKQKEMDIELQSKEATINKHKAQLFQLKSNKEYNTMQLEIEKMKADNSLLEEEILLSMEKIDQLKQNLNQEKEKLAVEENKLKKIKAKVGIETKELKQALDGLNAQRKRKIDGNIKPEVLALYERILKNRGEIALVPVKDDSCTGCFMGIRPQVVNELRLGKLLTCDNCSRILYVETNE